MIDPAALAGVQAAPPEAVAVVGPASAVEWPSDLQRMAIEIVTAIAAVAMVAGGVVPYIPQYFEIRRTQNTDGFSLYVCMFLLMANTLRILFWMGHPFEMPLLAQSVVMNTVMLLLVYSCLAVRGRQHIVKSTRDRRFTDFDWLYFWDWTDFMSYLECTLSFTLLGSILMYFFIDSVVFVETVGFLAVFVEAMLGSPQFYKNFRQKSTFGMSVNMVLMWTCGDTFKTVYFVLRSAPAQFWLCGLLQISIDAAILFQVVWYRRNTARKQRIEME